MLGLMVNGESNRVHRETTGGNQCTSELQIQEMKGNREGMKIRLERNSKDDFCQRNSGREGGVVGKSFKGQRADREDRTGVTGLEATIQGLFKGNNRLRMAYA